MSKIITLDFLHGYRLGDNRESESIAYQYDEGHVLEVKVPGSVTSAEVHYWTRNAQKAEAYAVGSITQEADGTYTITSNIPNSLFETYGNMRVYIVVTSDSASVVTYEGYIHVTQRAMPDDYVDDDPDNQARRVLVEAQEAANAAAQSAADAASTLDDVEEVAESIPADYSTLSQDVTDLKADLRGGNFPDLTAGSAAQLLSTRYDEDTEPYLFRASGGDAEVGDRLEEVIVGGSIVWNQNVRNGKHESAQYWSGTRGTIAYADDAITITSDGTGFNSLIYTHSNALDYTHKFFALFQAKTSNVNARIRASISASSIGNNAVISSFAPPAANTWYTLGNIVSPTNDDVSQFRTGAEGLSSGDTLSIRNVMLIDLTQMFGTTIADHIYSLEQTTAGAGVAFFRKLFPKDYYEYDAGTLKSVEGLESHVTVGKNLLKNNNTAIIYTNNGVTFTKQSDGTIIANGTATANHAQYQISIDGLCGDYYFTGCPLGGTNNTYHIYVWDGVANARPKKWDGITSTTNNTGGMLNEFKVPLGHRITMNIRIMQGVTVNNVVFKPMMLSPKAVDSEYEPYEKHSYPLDSSLILRGIPKLDANNKLYYDGDRYLPDGTVERRYGIVDMGTLDWTDNSSENDFASYITGRRVGVLNLICAKYPTTTMRATTVDKALEGAAGTTAIFVRDTSYPDAASFKTAMSGVMLVYELATPTTESAAPYTSPQIVDPYGTEEYVTTSIVPVGHESKYLVDLRGALEDLIDDAPKVVQVEGAAVTITGEANTRYMCGTVTSISITPPSSGIVDVVFTSGSTVATLTLPGTVKMPEWFDATSLQKNTIYEINIVDGVYGVVMTWPI